MYCMYLLVWQVNAGKAAETRYTNKASIIQRLIYKMRIRGKPSLQEYEKSWANRAWENVLECRKGPRRQRAGAPPTSFQDSLILNILKYTKINPEYGFQFGAEQNSEQLLPSCSVSESQQQLKPTRVGPTPVKSTHDLILSHYELKLPDIKGKLGRSRESEKNLRKSVADAKPKDADSSGRAFREASPYFSVLADLHISPMLKPKKDKSRGQSFTSGRSSKQGHAKNTSIQIG